MASFSEVRSSKHKGSNSNYSFVSQMSYDDDLDGKGDNAALNQRVANRKKVVLGTIAMLAVVVVGVVVGVSVSGSSSSSNTSAAQTVTDGSSAGGGGNSNQAGKQEGNIGNAEGKSSSNSKDKVSSSSLSGSDGTGGDSSRKTEGGDEIAHDEEQGTNTKKNEKVLPYKDVGFEWTNSANWQWADESAADASMFKKDSITVHRKSKPTPFRTIKGWSGEKVVYVEWTAAASSDTNIWMLNTKIKTQFGKNNGWPFFGELDIFEMFTADKVKNDKAGNKYDLSGFGPFKQIESYGQLTFHYGSKDPLKPCFCPASHSKSAWYKNSKPLVSGCSAQFQNTPNKLNRMATIFGKHKSGGHFIKLIQNPVVVKGANGTFDYTVGEGSVATPEIVNNKELYWGTPVSGTCNLGHNAATGFPFMEEFRLILEEQNPNGEFTVNKIQISSKI